MDKARLHQKSTFQDCVKQLFKMDFYTTFDKLVKSDNVWLKVLSSELSKGKVLPQAMGASFLL